MARAASSLKISNIPPRVLARLRKKADRLGTTPQDYVKQLVKEDLEMDRRAATTSFRSILGDSSLVVDEIQLDKDVEAARQRHFEATRPRKSKK